MYVPIDELREGDIVLEHGMRILIDGPVGTEGTGDRMRWVWPGLVVNADEVCNPRHPEYNAYIACHLRGQWWEDLSPRPRKDNWPIVSNRLPLWTVERSTSEEN